MIAMPAVAAPGGSKQPTYPFRKATLAKHSLMSTYSIAALLAGQNSWDLDSKGFARRIRLLVSGTETTATGDPASKADFPFNIFQRITLRDTSGGMLCNLKGYSAYLLQRYTKPTNRANIAASTDSRVYSASISSVQANTINFSIDLDLETGTRDNVGTIPNQNAAFRYQLITQFDAVANIVTTAANWNTSALVVQPDYWYYTVPAPTRPDGATNQQIPPFNGIIRQQFDESQVVASAAENKYLLTPGRVIRNLILVPRDTNGLRKANGITKVRFLYGDDTLLVEFNENDLATEAYMLWDDNIPSGVYPLTFCADNDGHPGADYRRDILDTRRLTQVYMMVTTASGVTSLDVIHDELIVPSNMSI